MRSTSFSRPDREQQQDEHEADHAGALHDAERDRPAAQLLGERPEDVAAVERQQREQVDHRERQRDQPEDEDRLLDVDVERAARRLVGADDAADLVAGLGAVEEPDDHADGRRRDLPHRVERLARRAAARVALVDGEAKR
jgi:hypothetical protein